MSRSVASTSRWQASSASSSCPAGIGTGTPEPGGLTTAQALTLLEELAGENWVGMDCVEVAPPYDHADLSSNAAATLVWTYLCGQAAKKAPE